VSTETLYDWKIEVSLDTKNKPFTAGSAQPGLAVFEVEVKQTGLAPFKSDPNNFNVIPEMQIIAVHAIPGGDEQAAIAGDVGKKLIDWLSLPLGNRSAKQEELSDRAIKKVLITFGHDPVQVAGLNGRLPLGPNALNSKRGFVFHEPYVEGVRDDKNRKQLTYLTREEAEGMIAGTVKPRLQNERFKNAVQPTAPGGSPVAGANLDALAPTGLDVGPSLTTPTTPTNGISGNAPATTPGSAVSSLLA
jgi:hypothetical protein